MEALNAYAQMSHEEEVFVWWDDIKLYESYTVVWATVANIQYVVNKVLWVKEWLEKPKISGHAGQEHHINDIVSKQKRLWPMLERKLGCIGRGLAIHVEQILLSVEMLLMGSLCMPNQDTAAALP